MDDSFSYYHFLIVAPLLKISDVVLFRTIDARLIDRLGVDGTAGLVRGVADRGLKLVQTGLIQSYILVMLIGSVCVVAYILGEL